MSNQKAYGTPSGLFKVATPPIKSRVDPTAKDNAPIGTYWINTVTDAIFFATSYDTVTRTTTWSNTSGGAGNFTSLRVDPGNTFLAGALSVIGPIVTSDRLTAIEIEVAETISANGQIVSHDGIQSINFENNASPAEIGLLKGRPPNGFPMVGDRVGILGFQSFNENGAESSVNSISSVIDTFVLNGGFFYPVGRLQFFTSPDGVTSNPRMEITQTGKVTVYATDNPAEFALNTTTFQSGAVSVSDDIGAGQLNQTIFTNVDVPAAGTSTGMVVQTSAGAATTASAGFIKIYVGNQTAYIPYWTQTT